ncbi:MAG: ribokinase [Tannerella sp.]|jgi:ribokinase|nr:ribokinase [Tannerella sp.]
MKKDNIIVVGSYIVALVMDTDRIPMRGETLMGRNFRQTYGGKGSNQAVQAARLGAKVSFVGEIGNDSFGLDFLKLCDCEGIAHDYVFIHEKLPTASGFIICAEGQNIITIDIGAMNDFGITDINRASSLFDERSVILMQLEIPFDTAIYAAKTGHKNGSTVILNPAPAKKLLGIDLSYIDYLTPNETEARICAGLAPNDPIDDIEVGRILLQLGCKNVIITIGEKGSVLVTPHKEIYVPAFKISDVVDSTGAGDAFNAGFATAISEGIPIEQSLRFANAVGALACTKADTIPSFQNRQQAENFIAEFTPS